MNEETTQVSGGRRSNPLVSTEPQITPVPEVENSHSEDWDLPDYVVPTSDPLNISTDSDSSGLSDSNDSVMHKTLILPVSTGSGSGGAGADGTATSHKRSLSPVEFTSSKRACMRNVAVLPALATPNEWKFGAADRLKEYVREVGVASLIVAYAVSFGTCS